MRRRVIANKASAIFWLLLGIASFPLGWYESIVLVWIASVYANIKTDWGTAEATDDSKVVDQIKLLENHVIENSKRLDQVVEAVDELLTRMSNQHLTTRDSL